MTKLTCKSIEKRFAAMQKRPFINGQRETGQVDRDGAKIFELESGKLFISQAHDEMVPPKFWHA